MRIIGGNLKRKKIIFSSSNITRPLKDMVRENVFNIIEHSNSFDINMEKSNILDLYAGIGSFGIECISRGANKVTFIEENNEAISTLNINLDNLKITKKCNILAGKVDFYLKSLNKDKFDIIFFDPPFSSNHFIDEIKVLKKLKIVKKNHLIIVHREKLSNDNLDEIFNVKILKKYGRSKIIFGNF